MRVFNTKIHKNETKLGDLLSLIGQECMSVITGEFKACIIKSIKIDSNVWVNVWDINSQSEFTVLIDDITMENNKWMN